MDEKQPKRYTKITLLIIAFILLMSGSFFAGIKYENWQNSKTQNYQGRGNFPGGFGGQRQRPTIGTVTSITDKTIKLALENNGGDKTITVSDATRITNNGSDANLSDIKNGDTLMVMGQTNSDGTIEAQMISINPSFNNYNNSGSTQEQ